MHDLPLITTIAGCATSALVLGLLAKRLGLSPIVGYLIAGVVVGPHTPGFVGDEAVAAQLAEIGVMLMMFGVGMHFQPADLVKVRRIAIPGALGQSLLATLACMGLALAAGWGLAGAVVLGVAVSVASTVVLLRCLEDHGLVEAPEGRLAVGWLLVEDVLTVLVLVLLPALAAPAAEGGNLWVTVSLAVGKLVLFMGIMLVVGTRAVPLLLHAVARVRSSELFTLTVLVMAIAVATAAYYLFGASMALGAFLAGMVVGQSRTSHQAAADLLPMRDAFAVLFFVSIGMLFDWRVVFTAPWLTVGLIVVILLVKPATAVAIVLLRGGSMRSGLVVAAGLAQIGEFSFILGSLAVSLDLMPRTGLNALVAAAIVSITLNPAVFRLFDSLRHRLRVPGGPNREVAGQDGNKPADGDDHSTTVDAVIVGYGPVGQTVHKLLRDCGASAVVVERNVDTVAQLQREGHSALFGDASKPEILHSSGLPRARFFVITVPQAAASTAILHAAQATRTEARVLCRAAYVAERSQLAEAGAHVIRSDEAETAAALAKAVLRELGLPRAQVAAALTTMRTELAPVRH